MTAAYNVPVVDSAAFFAALISVDYVPIEIRSLAAA